MGEPEIAAVAALFGDPARASMLLALLDRGSLSAGELALAANVSPQSASFHLTKLAAGELVVCIREGRHQVYKLAGTSVARAIEALAALALQSPEGRFRSDRMRQLRAARSCYDHLAGIAGVQFHDALLRLGYLTSKYELTRGGREWFASEGGSGDLLKCRSPFARACVDWSEKRPHLAGRLAAFLLDRFFEEGWIARVGDTRAIRFTGRGLRGFECHYGINLKTSTGEGNGYALHTVHDRPLQGRRL